jgi:hypothetical protein
LGALGFFSALGFSSFGDCLAGVEVLGVAFFGFSVPTPTIKEKPVSVNKSKDKSEQEDSDEVTEKPKKATPKTSTPAKQSPKEEKPKAEKKPKAPKKDVEVTYADMPDWKSIPTADLKDMANEKGVAWKDYNNDSITRMRLIMELKKTYQQ